MNLGIIKPDSHKHFRSLTDFPVIGTIVSSLSTRILIINSDLQARFLCREILLIQNELLLNSRFYYLLLLLNLLTNIFN